jgi:hypothetical protein
MRKLSTPAGREQQSSELAGLRAGSLGNRSMTNYGRALVER